MATQFRQGVTGVLHNDIAHDYRGSAEHAIRFMARTHAYRVIVTAAEQGGIWHPVHARHALRVAPQHLQQHCMCQ